MCTGTPDGLLAVSGKQNCLELAITVQEYIRDTRWELGTSLFFLVRMIKLTLRFSTQSKTPPASSTASFTSLPPLPPSSLLPSPSFTLRLITFLVSVSVYQSFVLLFPSPFFSSVPLLGLFPFVTQPQDVLGSHRRTSIACTRSSSTVLYLHIVRTSVGD